MSFDVVRFERSNYLSQFEQLPKSFSVNDKQILISRSSETTNELSIARSKAVFPYTVLVTSNLSDMPLPHVISPEVRYINFQRYPKAVQGLLLKAFFDKHAIGSGYYHLDTYQCEGKSVSQSVPDDIYIIKPENGARSLAIIEIDTSKMTMDEFFGQIATVHRKTNEWEAEQNRKTPVLVDPNAKKEELQENAPLDKRAARFKFFHEMIEVTGLKFKTGDENHKDEAVEQFFTQGQTIQRKCPFDNFIELRVIRSMNGKLLIVTREDLDQSWSGTTTIVTDQNFDKIMRNGGTATCTSILDNIRDSLSHPEFPGIYGSIDLWVSLKDRAWGIFEFQPQYNGENIPSEMHQQFMRDCIQEFIDVVK
jgi:hypothetical protein